MIFDPIFDDFGGITGFCEFYNYCGKEGIKRNTFFLYLQKITFFVFNDFYKKSKISKFQKSTFLNFDDF